MESLINNNYHIFKLYYPSKDKYNHPLESLLSTDIYKRLKLDICKLSGGLTVYPAQGLYITSNGDLIQDDISVITTLSDKYDLLSELMHFYAGIILESLNQESVLIEIDNIPEFYTGKESVKW